MLGMADIGKVNPLIDICNTPSNAHTLIERRICMNMPYKKMLNDSAAITISMPKHIIRKIPA